MALAGGGTPRRAYELLAASPFRERVPWERLHVFWGDERWVPSTDPRSNERMGREALLDRVPIPREQIHPMRCSYDTRNAAREYEALLLQVFEGSPRFDLVLLGVGADGHIASLCPGTAAAREKRRLVVAVPDRGEGFERLTLTAPAFNGAKRVVFAVSGSTKARALHEALQGERRPDRCPAQLIHPVRGEVTWLVDNAAASLLVGELHESTTP